MEIAPRNVDSTTTTKLSSEHASPAFLGEDVGKTNNFAARMPQKVAKMNASLNRLLSDTEAAFRKANRAFSKVTGAASWPDVWMAANVLKIRQVVSEMSPASPQ